MSSTWRERMLAFWPSSQARVSAVSGTGFDSEFDLTLVWVILALLALGLLMVYSASIPSASEAKFTRGNPFHFLQRQAFFVLIGLVLMVFVFELPTAILQRYTLIFFVLAWVLLMLVFIPHFGNVAKGARRWIALGPFNVQPAEVMKLIAILAVARLAVSKAVWLTTGTRFKDVLLRVVLPFLVLMSFVVIPLAFQRDFGTPVVILSTTLLLLFIAGLDWRVLLALFLLAALTAVFMVIFEPYRIDRLQAFLDPWKEEFGRGYQLTQSLMAIGRGGLWGLGLGAGVSKHYYLPEAHTDFILAVTAEELGLFGLLIVIGLYAFITLRAFKIGHTAHRLEQPFASLVARGIGLLFGIQTLINMAVNMGLVPTKGLTLPLMSYGGSSMIMSLIALAILLRIDWENRRRERGVSV